MFGGDLRVGDGYRVGDKGIPPNLPPVRTSRLSIPKSKEKDLGFFGGTKGEDPKGGAN